MVDLPTWNTGLKKALLLGLCILFLPLITPANAEERILSFHSDIVIHPDASLTVSETITVRAENQQIKRGIYRDFPIRYREKFGLIRRVGFEVLRVLRDGEPEAYHVESTGNGKRIYFGRKETILPPGDYTYTFVYGTDRQLGFFPEFDELYWNVTGNDWKFPIDRASAAVHLPEGAGGLVRSTAGYTGVKGAKGKDFREEKDSREGTVRYFATRPLGLGEGLTVAVSWPKGYVREPKLTGWVALAAENRGLLFGLAGVVAILFYYLVVWYRVGKDPEKGIIVVQYTPPGDLSPAAMRYVWNRGYDDRAFTAAVINLAVKGYLTIREAHGLYTAYRGQGEKKLPASKDEEKVYGSLFNNRQEVSFSRMNRSVLQSAISALKRQLVLGYEKAYFIQNRWYFLLGLLLTLFVVLGAGMREALDGGNLPLFLFISLWLTGWSVGVAFLLLMVVKSWTEVLKPTRTIGSFAGAVFITLFALPFLGGEIGGLFLLAFQATSPPLAALFLASIIITLVFYQLLKNVTPEGRKRLDEIEGFRTFLEATEKDRLHYLNSPTRTPELFEKFLPYALALDVEHQWAGQFAHILASAAAEGRSPAWYSGTSAVGLGTASLIASLGDSLSGAVASSSGSSGSGGGGSSGGGGGGGGGGGW